MPEISATKSADILQPRFLIWLLLILLCGAFLRFQRIGAASLWLDEIWSVEIAAGRGPAHNQLPAGIIQTEQVPLASLQNAPPWWTVWSSQSDYTNPPFYFLLLRLWMNCLGTSESAIRIPSAIFSVCAIFLFFDSVRLIHGMRTALLAAALMSISAGQIEFAREARAYALAVLLTLTALNALVRIEKFGSKNSRLIGLAVSLLLGMLTHYLFAGVAIAIAAYAVLRFHRTPLKKILAAFTGSAALFALLWAIPFYRQIRNIPAERAPFLYESGTDHISNTLLRLLYLPAALVTDKWPRGSFAADLPLLIVSVMAYLLLPIMLIRRRSSPIWLLWLAATAGMLCISDCWRGTDMLKYLRYTILAGPAVYAALCIFPRISNSIFTYLPSVAVIALSAAFSIQQMRGSDVSKEQWRSFSEMIAAKTNPDDLLVFTGNSVWLSPGIWYMGFNYYHPESHHPWLILHEPAGPDLLHQLQSRKTVWVIGFDPAQEGPRMLPGWKYVGYQYREQSVGTIGQMLSPDSADP